jgi:hypothetical protein
MPKKRLSAEQIVVLLRQIEVLMSQGKTAPIACREAGISQQSYYRWRSAIFSATANCDKRPHHAPLACAVWEAAHLSRAGQFCDARLRPAGKSIWGCSDCRVEGAVHGSPCKYVR